MPAHSALITVMERAARKAGSRLRRDFGEVEHLQVSKKGPADFVSKADMRAERILYDELLKVRPGWGFVLEEGGMIEGEEGKPRWIIDPLDGTTNFLHGDLGEWARIFGAVAPQVAGIRRNGSAALDLAWLAAGRYDGFFEAGLKVWDVAAGILMVREAGGFVTDYTGGDQPIGQGEILASNEALHSKLHRILAKSLL